MEELTVHDLRSLAAPKPKSRRTQAAERRNNLAQRFSAGRLSEKMDQIRQERQKTTSGREEC
jgi:hypothetical protein